MAGADCGSKPIGWAFAGSKLQNTPELRAMAECWRSSFPNKLVDSFGNWGFRARLRRQSGAPGHTLGVFCAI